MGEPTTPDPRHDDWTEHVVSVAGYLGFNKMRVRWKLIRWQEARRKNARRRENAITHIAYAHKTCGECGAVQDRGEALCTRCGTKLGSRGLQMLERAGLTMPVPRSMSTLLAVALLATYAHLWIAGGGGLRSPTGWLLVDLGGRWAPLMASEPWRVVTAVFLHGGLLHLVFNLLALANVGPRIEEAYGRTTMLALFVIAGAVANIATLQVDSTGVGIGASGGTMGLTGLAAAFGHRAGTTAGRALRDAMLQWAAYTFAYGFLLGADNWAHLFGMLTGIAFGLAVRPAAWRRRALRPLRTFVGLVGVVAAVGAVAIIYSRHPGDHSQPSQVDDAGAGTPASFPTLAEIRSSVAAEVEICIKLDAGDAAGARDLAVAAEFLEQRVEGANAERADAALRQMCTSLQQLRDSCSQLTATATATAAAAMRSTCETYGPALTRLPARRAPDPTPPAAN